MEGECPFDLGLLRFDWNAQCKRISYYPFTTPAVPCENPAQMREFAESNRPALLLGPRMGGCGIDMRFRTKTFLCLRDSANPCCVSSFFFTLRASRGEDQTPKVRSCTLLRFVSFHSAFVLVRSIRYFRHISPACLRYDSVLVQFQVPSRVLRLPRQRLGVIFGPKGGLDEMHGRY